ncbi:c-type cytochrome [Aquamicrobium soli]|uniref:C-type cytochrome n=1 Tax=Aquamicrobium soli TaxID=1811518 RepID=A0ABV7KDB1_9HYPH
MKQPRRQPLACAASLAVAAILMVSPAAAQDGAAIAANGVSGAPACASCHGTQGEGNAESGFPRLAGLNAAYLVHQLASFVDGTRKNDIMPPIAKALTPEQRQAVADFYAGQKVASATAEKPDAKLLARGAALAITGDWSHGVPACGQCHGPAGQGVGTAFPRLAGQGATYIENEIAAWKDGKRGNDPLHLMSGIAHKLSDDEVKAVAAYYAGLHVAKDSPHD